MQSTEAINLVEKVLRDLIHAVLEDSWREIPGINVDKLESTRAEDQERRGSGVLVPTDLLQYLQFYDLRNIITSPKRWHRFEAALPSKKHFEVYLSRLEGMRNGAMHSRDLLPFEISLVHGMVGEIRNCIGLWRTERGPDMDYYPTMDSVQDSFGQVWSPGAYLLNDPNTFPSVTVGDVVTFSCHGTDPQARELTWELDLSHRDVAGERVVGDDVAVEWIVTREDVAEAALVFVKMTSSGEFHRYGRFDGEAGFGYRVRPPR